MKISLFFLMLLVLSTALANGQTAPPARARDIRISALSIDHQGSVTLCRGDVEIVIDGVVLHADEADFDTDSGEVALRGNVQVKLLSTKASPQAAEGTQTTEPLKEPPARK